MAISTLFPTTRPSLSLDFAKSKRLDPRITFSRAQTGNIASYVDESGLIRYAGPDEPRFDHDPTTGESLGLLVEESRTNHIADSSFQNFGSLVTDNQWFEVSSSFDVTSNQGVSPDGGTNASSFYINTAAGYQAVQYRTSLATGTNYVFSVFAKAGAISDDVTLFLGGDITTNYVRAIFTLTGDGSYSGSTSNGTAVVASDPTIQAVGNGWYRCTIYATFASPTNITSLIYPGVFSSQAEGTTTYLWGAQLEEGSFPTSYIPTSGSGVNRPGDNISVTGTKFSEWYSQPEGTIKAEYSYYTINTQNFCPFSFDNGTSSQTIVEANFVPNGDRILSSGGANIGAYYYAIGEKIKRTVGYQLDNFGTSVQHSSVFLDTSYTPPTPTMLSIGHAGYFTSSRINGHVQRLYYYPSRLSNSQLQTLTK